MGKTVKHFAVGGGPLTDEEKQIAGESAAGALNQHKELLEKQAEKKPELDVQKLIKEFPWTPHQDRVVVLPDPAEYILDSGIIIPDSVTEKPQTGLIIALGDDLSTQNLILKQVVAIREYIDVEYKHGADPEEKAQHKNKPGDRVLFGKYAGIKVEVERVEYLIMRYADIIATLR